jgi:sec-independent protein translocase protein TatA
VFNQVGPLELILVLVIVLVIFGPKRLPSLGRQLGRGMREFKDSITGDRNDDAPELPAAAPEHPASESQSAEPTAQQRG